MSGESQNEMISLIGSEVRSLIIEEIKECLFFSIMADTTPDLSHKDILSLVIRYADNKGNIHERLIKTVEFCHKSGLGMAELLIKCLSELEIDSSKLAFQSYDFASNMSGRFNGVQKKITDIVEHNVPYIPCQDHRTNTVLEHACNVSALIRNFFDTLEELYVFFTSSTKRFKHLQEKIQEIDKSVQLKNLSRTRWTAKADSVRALNQTVDQIIEVLSDISKNREFDGSTRTKALGLYKKILNFDFIASFFFLKNILPKIKILTETIETPNLNIIDCINLIKTTALNLRNTDYNHNSLNSLIESAIKYAEKLNIDPYSDFSKYHRRRIMPKKIDENRDTEVDMDLKTFYRRDFQEILDTLSSGLNDNFEHIKKSIEPLYSVLTFPLDKRNITLKILGDIVAMFPPGSKKPDVHSLQGELEVLFDMNSEVSSFPELLSKVTKLKDNLNQAFCFCMFVLTVPYGVSTNERSFSQLKIIKNVLRTTMSNERLDNLMLLKMARRAQRILDMIPPINDPRDEQQSSSTIRPSELDSIDIQTNNIIYHEYDANGISSLPDSQFSLDILNSVENNEDIQATSPYHRIFNKPSLVIKETDSDSDSSSDESSSSSSSPSSSSSSSSSSTNNLKDFSSDDSVKDPTYEDLFSENRKAQSDSDEEQQPQAQLPDIQDFPQSAVDNQKLLNINSPSPGVDDQPPSVDEHPSSIGEQSPSVDDESRSRCHKRKAEPLLWKRNQSKLLKNKDKMNSSSGVSRVVRLKLADENNTDALETHVQNDLATIEKIKIQRLNYVGAEKNETVVFIETAESLSLPYLQHMYIQ
ncbi:unnamed protein product [Diabrotica balteata]|uniref:DUF4371 domain-containing protein n=1 Tax=Diabrotica balteata TaxID=107213 RepID=A0A9N9SVR3_DIABA|nr:unnamed protein product [Diabrotica balteata]